MVQTVYRQEDTMRLEKRGIVVLGIALVGWLATPVSAQNLTAGLRIGAGLSFQFDDGETGVGFTGDVRGNIMPLGPGHLGWVGDISFHNFDGFTTAGYLGGVSFNIPINDKFSAYGQFLLGLEHCCEFNAFSLQPGGGVDFRLTNKMDARVGFDMRSSDYDGTWFHTPRLWFGVSFVPGRQ